MGLTDLNFKTLDSTFSSQLKTLIAASRKIAIDLGYDYISTIHFFLAGCESKEDDSILKFGFDDEAAYENFRKQYILERQDYPDLSNQSLPLTIEAETTVRCSEKERGLQGHDLVFPGHLFVAALKNKESYLAQCFAHDEYALEKLLRFYGYAGQECNTKMPDGLVPEKMTIQKGKNDPGIWEKIKRLFRFKG